MKKRHVTLFCQVFFLSICCSISLSGSLSAFHVEFSELEKYIYIQAILCTVFIIIINNNNKNSKKKDLKTNCTLSAVVMYSCTPGPCDITDGHG